MKYENSSSCLTVFKFCAITCYNHSITFGHLWPFMPNNVARLLLENVKYTVYTSFKENLTPMLPDGTNNQGVTELLAAITPWYYTLLWVCRQMVNALHGHPCVHTSLPMHHKMVIMYSTIIEWIDYHLLLFIITELPHVFLFPNNEHLTLTIQLYISSDSDLQAKMWTT